jgi:hypothetical protein
LRRCQPAATRCVRDGVHDSLSPSSGSSVCARFSSF